MSDRTRAYYRGYRMVESDLVKELGVALLGVLIVVLACAFAFSSPDDATLTARQVADQHPRLLVHTALDALDGQGAIASYGPPYNHGTGSLQSLGPISPQRWMGVTLPVSAARMFVLTPLSRMEPLAPAIRRPLRAFEHASAAQQSAWEAAYGRALPHSRLVGAALEVPTRAAGPLPALMSDYLALARTGTLESTINLSGRVYQTDFTHALLFLQGQPLQDVAAKADLLGTEWGMMKEPGNYPGAVWLWFYTLLYQIPPYSTSSSGDLMVGLTVGLVTLILMFVPWIPGLRDIPYRIPIYKSIWRRHYAEVREGGSKHDAP